MDILFGIFRIIFGGIFEIIVDSYVAVKVRESSDWFLGGILAAGTVIAFAVGGVADWSLWSIIWIGTMIFVDGIFLYNVLKDPTEH